MIEHQPGPSEAEIRRYFKLPTRDTQEGRKPIEVVSMVGGHVRVVFRTNLSFDHGFVALQVSGQTYRVLELVPMALRHGIPFRAYASLIRRVSDFVDHFRLSEIGHQREG